MNADRVVIEKGPTILDTIRINTHREGEHLIWGGLADMNGYCGFRQNNVKVNVVRTLWAHHHGGDSPYRLARTCGVEKCVDPEHHEPTKIPYSRAHNRKLPPKSYVRKREGFTGWCVDFQYGGVYVFRKTYPASDYQAALNDAIWVQDQIDQLRELDLPARKLTRILSRGEGN